MEKITVYKLSDGTFIEDEHKAVELQKRLDIKTALLNLCTQQLQDVVDDDSIFEVVEILYDKRKAFISALTGDKLVSKNEYIFDSKR